MKKFKHIDVKFDTFRWTIFILAAVLGGFIGGIISSHTYIAAGIGGGTLGSLVYFGFYFYDNRKNLKYWHKGVITGFIFGLIVTFGYTSLPFLSIFLTIFALFLIILFEILNVLSSDPWGAEGIAALAILFSPIFYGLIGALIGLIIGKVKGK